MQLQVFLLKLAESVVLYFAVDSRHDQVREAKDARMAEKGVGPRGGQGGCSKMRQGSIWSRISSDAVHRSTMDAILADSVCGPDQGAGYNYVTAIGTLG